MKQLSDDEKIKNVEVIMKLVDIMPEPRRTKVIKMLEGPVGRSYFTAPASGRLEYHNCFPGGLADHSLRVVNNLSKITKSLVPERYPRETLVFVGLFHDLGKASDGEHEYYVPVDSEWHREKLGKLYESNKKCPYMPNSERGLYILQKNGIEVSAEEYLAIRLNDGQYAEANRPYSMKEPDLAILLSFADLWSTRQEKL